MANEINTEVWRAIKLLMEKSFWGKYASTDSLILNLKDEIDEFIQGCKNKDIVNSKEEAADVIMIILCFLYKNSYGEEISIDEIMELIIKKLKRRYVHLFENDRYLEPQKEEEVWQKIKKSENVASYMLCDNISCPFYRVIGGGNIKNLGEVFCCKKCGNEIKVSKKTVLFYNRNNRKKYIDTIVESIIEYTQGSKVAPKILKVDFPKIYYAFCNEILKSDYEFMDSFINYICVKYRLNRDDVLEYCKDVLKEYDVKCNKLVIYCQEVLDVKGKKIEQFYNKEYKNMRDKLSDITFDVVKRIERTVKYNARNWNNQLIHRYLLDYRIDGVSRIIECMTIVHYNDDNVRDLTIELSNMYNCVVGCRFCASAALPETTYYLDAMDYVRQLNTCLKSSGINPDDFNNFFVSFAGIGEPSVVYKTIVEGMMLIQHLYPHVKFNIATFGFNDECFDYWGSYALPIRTIQIPFYSDRIEKLKCIVKNLPKNYCFKNILAKAISFRESNTDCQVKVNYIVMKDINDSNEDVKRMCEYLSEFKQNIVIKVSYLNYTKPGEENNIVCPGSKRLKEIEEYLNMQGYSSYIFGTDTNTELGCGQLAQNHISSKNL